MFFHLVLEKKLLLHPMYFGPHLREKLVAKLIAEVEGQCTGRHGFVVAVTGVDSVGAGMIRDGTGYVSFPVRYKAIVFRPFKEEILECVVTTVNKLGFFAEAGPVQVFVSNCHIPDDMAFTPGDVNSYQMEDGSVKIQAESVVRLKIIGMRVDATQIQCIGTIKPDYLGLVSEGGPTI